MAKVIYKGASALNGAPVRAILTEDSENDKTGRMAQLFILPDAEAPHNAQRTGGDASVCGMCPQRPALGGGCYVVTFQGPLSTWKATGSKGVAGAGETCASLTRPVRLGAYGDPAALPFDVNARLAAQAPGWTGYTHQWRDCDPRFASLTMASCDSPEDREEAKVKGWRTFRARPVGAPPQEPRRAR